MMDNPIRAALRDGGVAVGTMVMEFTVPAIGRIAAAGGAEFVLFDMEHTGLSTERFAMLAGGCLGAGVAPVVRVPSAEYQLLARPLEVGAMGLMLPCVERPAQVEAAVRLTKYPPMGRRGTAFGIAHDGYVRGDVAETMRRANEQNLLIAQIESPEGVEQADAIAAVPGVDVLWVGHNDLTTSMGIPGQFEHPDYVAALRTVAEACRRNGKVAGFRPDSVAQAKELLDLGYRCLAYLSDVALYRNVLREGITAIRDVSAA